MTESQQTRAQIVTTEHWPYESGTIPAFTTDEPFSYVISDMGREGVTWLRVHLDGMEIWVNLAQVVSIHEVHAPGDHDG